MSEEEKSEEKRVLTDFDKKVPGFRDALKRAAAGDDGGLVERIEKARKQIQEGKDSPSPKR